MLAESGLLAQLQQHAWFGNDPLSIYGDPTYPLSIHWQALFRGPDLTDEQKHCNKVKSSVTVSVEWLLRLVRNYFKFIDFKQMQRIGISPVGKIYVICALLQNLNIFYRVISSQIHLIWSHQTSGTTFGEKKCCIQNIVILRKYIFLYIIHIFFVHGILKQ